MDNRIKELRLEKGLSQRKLSEKTGISQQALSLYEKGERKPKIETWQKLADYFDVSVSYLQGVTDKKDVNITFYRHKTIKRDVKKERNAKIDKIVNDLEKNMTEKEWAELTNLLVLYNQLDTKDKNNLKQYLKKLIKKYTNLATDTSANDPDVNN
ncbi:helix-turn-helix transcriptional regulator [Ligilactobacillus animalis]|nr:helix-turn-helix transcriptional regulator [Ligilactobacillus animalis]